MFEMKPMLTASVLPPVSLRRVLVLKNIAVVGQTLAVLVVAHGLGMPLPFEVIGGVLLHGGNETFQAAEGVIAVPWWRIL